MAESDGGISEEAAAATEGAFAAFGGTSTCVCGGIVFVSMVVVVMVVVLLQSIGCEDISFLYRANDKEMSPRFINALLFAGGAESKQALWERGEAGVGGNRRQRSGIEMLKERGNFHVSYLYLNKFYYKNSNVQLVDKRHLKVKTEPPSLSSPLLSPPFSYPPIATHHNRTKQS